jgi:hypothetical protein
MFQNGGTFPGKARRGRLDRRQIGLRCNDRVVGNAFTSGSRFRAPLLCPVRLNDGPKLLASGMRMSARPTKVSPTDHLLALQFQVFLV